MVDLVEDSDGWKGTIDIPEQGVRNAPQDGLRVDDNVAYFSLAKVPGDPSFRGRVDGDDRITGSLHQSGGLYPFKLSLVSGIAPEDLGPNRRTVETAGIPGEGLEGVWYGVLDSGVGDLRLLTRFSRNEAGRLRGTMDSLDQGARGMRPGGIKIEGSAVKFGLPQAQARFEGVMSLDGSTLTGEWFQSGAKPPLQLKRQEGEPEIARPQDPKRPFPYEEREVEFRNESADLSFAGTLTVPKGKGPFRPRC